MDLTSRLFMMAASKGAGAASGYWYATLGSANSDVGLGIRIGSDNSLYLNAASTAAVYAVKYSPTGSLNWQRRLTVVTASTTDRKLAIDSSDSTYLGYSDSGTATNSVYVAAYNSSGALQWQKRWNHNGRSLTYRPSAVCYGSNLYVGNARISQTSESPGGNTTGLLTKSPTSTGAVTWSRNTYNTDNNCEAITVDSSENIYMAHDIDRSTLYNYNSLAVSKFSSAGSRLWTSTVSGEAETSGTYRGIFAYDIALDSSVNIYVAGVKENTSSVNRAAIFKFNSSGTIQWARALGTTSGIYHGVTTDSSGTIYACGYIGNVAVVVSYTSSGTINWQRSWTGGVSDVFRSIAVDSNGDLCICGSTSSAGQGSNDILILKVPSDGSMTGTYENFTYAVSTYTNATETASAYTPSGVTTYSQTITVTDSTFSEAAGSLVSDTTNL